MHSGNTYYRFFVSCIVKLPLQFLTTLKRIRCDWCSSKILQAFVHVKRWTCAETTWTTEYRKGNECWGRLVKGGRAIQRILTTNEPRTLLHYQYNSGNRLLSLARNLSKWEDNIWREKVCWELAPVAQHSGIDNIFILSMDCFQLNVIKYTFALLGEMLLQGRPANCRNDKGNLNFFHVGCAE